MFSKNGADDENRALVMLSRTASDPHGDIFSDQPAIEITAFPGGFGASPYAI